MLTARCTRIVPPHDDGDNDALGKIYSAAVPGGVEQAEKDARTSFEVEISALQEGIFDGDSSIRVSQPVLYLIGRESGPLFEAFEASRRLLERTSVEGGGAMSSRNERLIERFYHELWNRFDRSVFAELLVEDLQFRGSLGHEKRGHIEFGEYVDFIQRAFPDFRNHIEEIVSEGDRAFARLSYTGTHRGEIFGVPPTGRRVQYAGAALFRFRGNRIASVWVLGDIYGLLQQLRGGPSS